MAEKCAKASGPPPSGWMNPKPLASLNHLTVPLGMACLRFCLHQFEACLVFLSMSVFPNGRSAKNSFQALRFKGMKAPIE
jgi:hypothetical protein